jgi:hypothetical protein
VRSVNIVLYDDDVQMKCPKRRIKHTKLTGETVSFLFIALFKNNYQTEEQQVRYADLHIYFRSQGA